MSLYLGTNLVSGVATPIQGARNIGQIIQSTIPLTDAGLHLLDGSLIQGGGVYGDFYNYIAGIVNTYPNLFVTEATWQAEVASHGVCGKFVFDDTNRTVRLPLITGITQSSESINALGDYIQAGLPNITGEFAVRRQNYAGRLVYSSGAFYDGGLQGPDDSIFYSTDTVSQQQRIKIDASRSSYIYGNSSTVQPPAIKVLYYIVIANSTKTDIQVDIDDIVTDLNNKLDKNDLATVHCVIETYQNGTSWYRIYDDGWCEQGGVSARNLQTIQLLKAYANTNYIVFGNILTTDAQQVYGNQVNIMTKTTTNFSYPNSSGAQRQWHAYGYIS